LDWLVVNACISDLSQKRNDILPVPIFKNLQSGLLSYQ